MTAEEFAAMERRARMFEAANEKMLADNKRLREENARYKLTYAKYVEATDRMNGAPCEQIRHQQEVDALREENARLREALKPFAKNYWSDDWHDGSDCEINVQLRDIRRAAAAIREGGNDE